MNTIRRERYLESYEERSEIFRTALLRATLAFGTGFILLPLMIVAIYSFSEVAYGIFPPPGFSTKWYAHLFAQATFRGAFFRSVGIGISATTIALLVGFPTSLALARTRLAAGNFLRAFILSPIVIPKIVLGVGWFIFFARISLIGGWIPLILAHTVIVLPFVVAILTANLSGLDPTIEEAAQDLGAGFVKVLWYVILPQIKSGVIISALLAFIVSFDQVESSIFLVRGENNTLPIEMFLYMEKWQDPTIAALSTLLIGFAAVITCATVAISRGIDLSNLLPTLGGKKSTR